MKKSMLVTAGVAAAGMLLSACGGGTGGSGDNGASGGEPVVDGTLTMAINEDPGNLFRDLNTGATLSYVYPWAYESPVFFDKDGKPHGWLAEKWKDTPTSLSFTIRKGVKCDDGTDLTAETVANNYRWILDPKNGSPFVGLVIPADAKVQHDNAKRTVTLTTKTPNSFLLPQIGVHPIYCQGALDDPDSVQSATNGTGMFSLTEAVPNDHYTFTRRDEYDWAPEGGNNADTPGVPKQVVVRVVENPSTRANLLLSGELQMAAVQGPDEARLEGQTDELYSTDLVTGGFAYSQAEGKPTTDENVRIALTKALDLDSLMKVQTADQGERVPGLAVMAPRICDYDAAGPNLPGTDVAEAESMLDDAGWKVGSDGIRAKGGKKLTMKLVYNTRWPETASTVELIQKQWEAVGVQVDLEGSDYNAFSEKVYAPNASQDFDAVWLSANYNVPNVLSAFISGPTPPKGNNMAAIENPDFDKLVAQTSKYTGTDACGAWEKAEAEMYASADYVPFAMRPDVTYSKGVHSSLGTSLDGPLGPAITMVQ